MSKEDFNYRIADTCCNCNHSRGKGWTLTCTLKVEEVDPYYICDEFVSR